MAIKKEIEKSLDIIKKKLDDPKLKANFSNFSKNMQFTFSDLETVYSIIVKNGEIESIKEESIESPDIQVIIESNILIDILNKKINPIKAYASGQLKAKGQLADLLKLLKLL
jgi:putative sterol carrier protein